MNFLQHLNLSLLIDNSNLQTMQYILKAIINLLHIKSIRKEMPYNFNGKIKNINLQFYS